MPSKLNRQTKIKELLYEQDITSQEQLVSLLAEHGIEVTQATLSRDFAELGVIRHTTDGGMRYVLHADETSSKVSKLFGYEIVSVDHNESLIVIRTLAGRAQGVAYYIDRLNKPEILGTVAGDDTVLVIPDSHGNIPAVVNFIKELMLHIPK